MENPMELENFFLRMAHIFMALLPTDSFMGKEDSFQAIDPTMRVKFGIIWRKEKESLSTTYRNINIMEIGRTTSQMEKVKKNGETRANILGSL